MRPALRLARCERGVAAIEFAFAISLFLVFVLGIMKIAIMLWDFSSLHYAVEAAERCAAVDPTDCGSSTAVDSYALAHYYGESGIAPYLTFGYSTAGCGHTVTVSYTYTLTIPLAGDWSVPMGASACYP
jgi:hypothetical protein